MRKVNELFGKEIVNQKSGNRIATVRDIVLSADSRRIVALLASSGGMFAEDRVVPWSAISGIGDFVVIDGREALATLEQDTTVAELHRQAQRISGMPVISASGERLGTVNDLMFEESGLISGFELKQGLLGGWGNRPFLASEHVQAIGKDALIASAAGLAASAERDAEPPVTPPLPESDPQSELRSETGSTTTDEAMTRSSAQPAASDA